MEEPTRKVGKQLVCVVHKPVNDNDPVSELTMENLRKEVDVYGAMLMVEIKSGKTSVNDARYQIRVKAAVDDSVYNLNPGQLEELIRIGFKSAGVLREQLTTKAA